MTPHSRRFRELFKEGVTIEKFIANIDLVTEEMDRKRAAMAAGDYSEFEFNENDDNLPVTKQICVKDLSKSNVRIRPPTLGLNDLLCSSGGSACQV